MNPELALKLAEVALTLIAQERARSGQTVEEICAAAGQTLDLTEAKLVRDLARLQGGR